MVKKHLERGYFYLKGDETLGDIIDLLRKAKDKEIVLVVPANSSSVFYHPIHVEVLSNEIKKLKKEIFISTDDLKIIDLCRHFGIPLFLEEYKNLPLPETVVKDVEIDKTDTKKISQKLPKFPWKILIALIIVIGLGFILILNLQTKVKIYLTLTRFQDNINEVVQVNGTLNNVDVEKLALPGKIVDLEANLTVSVETSGTRNLTESFAKGLIEIQNLNTIPLVLRSGTRFAYQDKIYRIKDSITLPAKTDSGPGVLIVEVIADEPGEKMNLDAGTEFIIPGLKNTPWEPLIKAVAKTDIKSVVGNVKAVASEDINNVRLKLENELKNKLSDDLQKNYPGYVYDIDGAIFNIDVLSISHKVGEITDRISATGKAKMQTVVVNKDDILNLVKALTKKTLNYSGETDFEKINLNKITILDLNSAKQTAIIKIDALAVLKPHLNLNELKNSLAGRNLDEVKSMLSKDERISSAKIEIFPSWKNSLPSKLEKIELVVN